MFEELKYINHRPGPFEFYTAQELWTDEHTARRMLEYHLHESIDAASRNHEFIERSVEWIVDHFGVDEETEIADFGCGPGLYANRLAGRGAKVTGIDFSGNSLAYAGKTAAEQGLTVNYVESNYLDYVPERQFDLVMMIMCDFCAMSPEQRQKMLVKFGKILKPEGRILLDVYSLHSFVKKEESATYEKNQLNGFWSAVDYYCFVNTFKYEKEQVSLDKYTIYEENRTRVVYNWLQYYSQEMITKEFAVNELQINNFNPGAVHT